MADLRALEATQRRFVADVSHELRTPLTALTTAADVLEAHQRRARRHRAGGRPACWWSSPGAWPGWWPTSWRSPASTRAWPPWPGTTSTWPHLVRGALASRGWTARVETRLEPGVVIAADPRRLDAVIGNLVGNAFEHGRPPVRVHAGGRRRHASGCRWPTGATASPPSTWPSVFERFSKADPSRPRSAGSGLGLAIARENARLHGGDVTVANRPGAGAVFTVVLPRTRSRLGRRRLLPTCYLPATRPVTTARHDGLVDAHQAAFPREAVR